MGVFEDWLAAGTPGTYVASPFMIRWTTSEHAHRLPWLFLYSITASDNGGLQLVYPWFLPIVAAIGVGGKMEGSFLCYARGKGESHALIVAASLLKPCNHRDLFVDCQGAEWSKLMAGIQSFDIHVAGLQTPTCRKG